MSLQASLGGGKEGVMGFRSWEKKACFLGCRRFLLIGSFGYRTGHKKANIAENDGFIP